MSEYLLGLDIGTSACKIAVFDRNGAVVTAVDEKYPVIYQHEGWAEQNPDDWWNAICKGIKRILAGGNVKPTDIAGIGVDGQSWSAIPIDKDGNALTNTPIWMDTRGHEICNRLNERIGADNIFNVCGNPLQPSYSTSKVIWYQENLPEVYAKTDKILQSNSWIVFKLTGVISQDLSQGYGFHCFDMRHGRWNVEMAKELGIPVSFLPDIYPCHEIVGKLNEKAAAETGLPVGIPVAAGGLDACCGTLGAGVIHQGETQEQGGQAGGMSICTYDYKVDPRLIMSFHVVPNCWLLQGGTVGGGGTMRWFEQEFGAYERESGKERGKSSLQIFNELAEEINAGSDGLVFLPYMSGERSPIWNPKAKGVFYGVDYSKTKAHFIRATMEGVAFSLRHNLDIAASVGAGVSEMRAVGGSANSLLWTQIKADVTGKPVVVPASDTATTLGAALLAGVGIGMYKDFEEACDLTVEVKRRHEPSDKHKAEYDRNYNMYLEIYENLKGMMC